MWANEKGEDMETNNFKSQNGSELDANYSLDAFKVAPVNRVAVEAAMVVAEGSLEYNPFVIYGEIGVGKTHLLQAIGNKALKENASQKIIYVTGERFVNDFINSVRNSTTGKLREHYRSADLLLFDEMQFLAGKESSQEEFFNTFNAIFEHNGRIVAATNQLPKDVLGLQERLASRFQAGLSVGISKPDFETSEAILLELAEKSGIAVGPDVSAYIAKQVDGNVRELKGIFKQITIATKINGEFTLDDAHKIVEKLNNAYKA